LDEVVTAGETLNSRYLLESNARRAEQDLLSWATDALESPPHSLSDQAGRHTGIGMDSAVGALKMLRGMYRSSQAYSLGLEVTKHFEAARLTVPPDQGRATSPLADTELSSSGLENGELVAQSGEDESEDSPDIDLIGQGDDPADLSLDDASEKRRKWGDRPSAILPETHLLREHFWALNRDESRTLSTWVDEVLSDPVELSPGTRPPSAHFFEGLLTGFALSSARAPEDAGAIRFISDLADEELSLRDCLPTDRYIRLGSDVDGDYAGCAVAFPPGDRFRKIWEDGTVPPLDYPEKLVRRIGQLAAAVRDCMLEELFPFNPSGWGPTATTVLCEKFGRSSGEVALAVRHALARELYSQTASRALIDLLCGGPNSKQSDTRSQIALTHYVYPGSARNRHEFLIATSALIAPGSESAPPKFAPGGIPGLMQSLTAITTSMKGELKRLQAVGRMEFHNALAVYTLTLLVVTTGHRRSSHPFYFPWDLDLKGMVAFLCDKLVVGSEARFLPLVDTVAQQIIAYRTNLVELVAELQGEAPDLADTIAQAAGLDLMRSNRSAERSSTQPISQFFLIQGKTLKSLDTAQMETAIKSTAERAGVEIDEDGKFERSGSLTQALRRNFATYLWNSGASGVHVEAMLGHNRQLHVFGRSSTWSVCNDLQKLAPLIEAYLLNQGWEPVWYGSDRKSQEPLPLLLPVTGVGTDGYEGRERDASAAKALALSTLADELRSELAGSDDVLELDDEQVNQIRARASEALEEDPPAQRKLLECFSELAEKLRSAGVIRVTARQLNTPRTETGPVNVSMPRKLSIANVIRDGWAKAATAAIEKSKIFGTERETRLAVVLGSFVVCDGLLAHEQAWPLLEAVMQHQCLEIKGRVQVRARVVTKSVEFERVLYASQWTSAAIRGVLVVNQASSSLETDARERIEKALHQVLSLMAKPKPGYPWTLRNLIRAFVPYWFLRQPGYIHSIAKGESIAPSADAISEATLLGANPPRVPKLKLGVGPTGSRSGESEWEKVDKEIASLIRSAEGRFTELQQASKTQRGELRRILETELSPSLQIYAATHSIVEIRLSFLAHMVAEGGIEGGTLAFNSIRTYDSRLARLYAACWSIDLLELTSEEFDELYARMLDDADQSAGSKVRAKQVDAKLLKTAINNFHYFLRQMYGVPASKVARIPGRSKVRSRPRSALLPPRLNSALLRHIKDVARTNSILGDGIERFALVCLGFGTRKKEALSRKYEDFEFTDDARRLRIRSNLASKIKNPRAGRRVVPLLLADDPLWSHFPNSLTLGASTANPAQFVFADPAKAGGLLDDNLISGGSIEALRRTSGNPSIVNHSLRHGFATGLICALTPQPAQNAAVAGIRKQYCFGDAVQKFVASLTPSPAAWPWNVERAAMWQGAGTETVLNVYFKGSAWIAAELADAHAIDAAAKDSEWACLLGLTRTSLPKLRARLTKAEGSRADLSAGRLVGHYLSTSKLGRADVIDTTPSDVDDQSDDGSGRYRLGLVDADRLLMLIRTGQATPEELVSTAEHKFNLDPQEVSAFFQSVKSVVHDTGLRVFEAPATQAKTTRLSRTGVSRRARHRQQVLARLESLMLQTESKEDLLRLVNDWRLWVDGRRPLIIVRQAGRVQRILRLLMAIEIGQEDIAILATKSAAISEVTDDEWLSTFEFEKTAEPRFSRGPRRQGVAEFAIDLRPLDTKSGFTNEDFHRAMITIAAMVGVFV
jgi:integrase